jgi:hypothetical protein
MALGLAVALGLAAAAQPAVAAPVAQVVSVKVNAGMLDQYLQETQKLQGVLTRLGSRGTMRVWNTTAGGPDTGTILVAVEYPDMAAWAADSPRIQADAEWKKLVAGLATVRTLLGTSIWRDISPEASASSPGKVLLLTGAEVEPGQLETYRQRVATSRAISGRLGLKGRLRMWQAQLAGPEAGSVAVGVEYPDVATYVAEQEKLSADPEWQKLLSGLDGVRKLRGRWLYQEITP